MTVEHAMEAGVEMLVIQYLPLPKDETCELLEWLEKDITEIDNVPLAVYEEAIPEYLSTGRPLALLDLKHKSEYPFDRLARMVMNDAWLCERVLAGLDAGLASNQMRRAKAYTRNDTETAQALAALERVIEAEIKKLNRALKRKDDDRASQAAEAAKQNPSSWADDFGTQQRLSPRPTPFQSVTTNKQNLILADKPATEHARAKFVSQDPVALDAAELDTFNRRTPESVPMNLTGSPPISSTSTGTARTAVTGFAVPSTVSTPTALSLEPLTKTDATPVRQNPHARLRL